MQPPPLLRSRTFSFPPEGNPIPIKQSLPLLASPNPWKLLTRTKWWSCLHIQPEASPPQLHKENLATSCKAEISNSSGFMFKLLEGTKPSNEDTFLWVINLNVILKNCTTNWFPINFWSLPATVITFYNHSNYLLPAMRAVMYFWISSSSHAVNC